MSLQQLARRREQPIRLGAEHGYRIEADQIFINADLSLPAFLSGHGLALELWACPAPHASGSLQGIEMCQVPLELPTPLAPYIHHVEAHGDARLPPQGRPFAMVLALVELCPDGQRTVHDFSNYPQLETFYAPRLDGNVGYSLLDGSVTLRADAVTNPRAASNTSGSLSLQLWASPASDDAASEADVCLAALELPRLSGQCSLRAVEGTVSFSQPPAGRWRIDLRLLEWTGAHGYVTRDSRVFAQPHEVACVQDEVADARDDAAQVRDLEPPHELEQPLDAAESAAPVDDVASVTSSLPAEPTELEPAPAELEPAPAELEPAPARRGGVSVHTATVEELAKVKGLNLKVAKEIIKARPFESLNDLVKVRGIGTKTLQRIKSLLTL